MLSLGLSICSPAVWSNGAFVPSSASTAALLAALTGSYSKSLKQAWDDAIGAMEASGAWADFDILYPKGAIPGTSAANIADGYLNWKNPGAFTLISVNSTTNGDGYWQGDGSSARLRTQFTPSLHAVKYLQNDASLMLWAKEASAGSTADAGSINAGSPPAILYVLTASNNAQGTINGSGATTASSNGLGLTIVQRRANDDVRLYKNGSQIGTTNTGLASTGNPSGEQWILGGNSTQFSSGKKIQLAAWGASQASREASIYSTFQTLFTAAGTI
jgi:hypothetical protein